MAGDRGSAGVMAVTSHLNAFRGAHAPGEYEHLLQDSILIHPRSKYESMKYKSGGMDYVLYVDRPEDTN